MSIQTIALRGLFLALSAATVSWSSAQDDTATTVDIDVPRGAFYRQDATGELGDRAGRRAWLRERWQERRTSGFKGENGNERGRARTGTPYASPDNRPGFLRPPPGRRTSPPTANSHHPIHSGYLFIDGEYLAPPYALRVDSQRVFVNDHEIALPPRPNNDQLGNSGDIALWWSDRLLDEMRVGSVILLAGAGEANSNIQFLPRFEEGYQLLKHISGEASGEFETGNTPLWLGRFKDYEPSPKLRDRLASDMPQIEITRQRAEEIQSRAKSLGRWAYPLTAIAMLLVAIASGQLFVSRALLCRDRSHAASDISQATQRCILFIVCLSLLDLICTLAAHQAGVMHELNPLGGSLIGNPLALIAFKISITFGAAAMLYALRGHFSARRAAWWLCLVFVLVTVRWVAFNSLFVT